MTEVPGIREKAVGIVAEAGTLRVSCPATFIRAGEILRGIKGLLAEIAATFDPVIAKAHQAHREAIAAKKRHEGPLLDAEAAIKYAIAAYHEEQEQIRLAEEARLREEVRRQAEETQITEAVAMEAAGSPEAAEAILNLPVEPPAVVVPSSVPRVEGMSFREEWDFEVIDPSRVPDEYKMLDETKIRRVVRALKSATNIPGIRPVSRKVVAARGMDNV